MGHNNAAAAVDSRGPPGHRERPKQREDDRYMTKQRRHRCQPAECGRFPPTHIVEITRQTRR
ncbi:hypothetical protein IEO21_01739 [Rhodonia placenta]|uniref:Uncharacterized protein n=2 Tax=Rhodonia placenta TaxID=104341 RepID=A0A1X6NFB1_9APHY|nr:hypothetical protein POSPLADRAFT_1042531 [Postia placenta MAD-698-R-SB12]KAF9819878.1 hypothetical protein IEO21_01739 [Postia placenta]OSX67294.1 hypothetical protein POSPLADRAFT_1042531 [Postia placenta MAD-698-R-SB12]